MTQLVIYKPAYMARTIPADRFALLVEAGTTVVVAPGLPRRFGPAVYRVPSTDRARQAFTA